MHYNDQLCLLDSLVDSDEKLPDNERVTFLESAVESVPDLRHVKITDNVLQAQLDSTRPISYRSYFDLLKDAAFHLEQATKRGNKIRHTNVHFSGPNDEDEHQNLSSDDNQVIQQENVCSEPPEPLSYSLFQSHFQGSSTSNTQKIFLPKPIWEKLSKDQQQMIIDHNRSLPKSGSPHLSTPNKSPSPLPHKPTPQQTAKSQRVHTHGQPLEDIKFKLKINKNQAEEIMSYNQLMDFIQKGTDAEEDPDSLFKFRGIVAHQGPLESTDPDHKGSKYNVMVEWESGEVTYEPLTLISKDDPITCAVYAKKHDLLDTTGWKHLKRYAKTSKRLIRAVKQSRIRQVRASARYQHGFQVPKDYNDAIRLDKENSSTHWQDAMDLELTQIHDTRFSRTQVKHNSTMEK